MIGIRFGMLIVVSRAGSRKTKSGSLALWECDCDCGKSVVVAGANLRSGNSRSCGCVRAAKTTAALVAFNTTHGMTGRVEFSAWTALKNRCENPQNRQYKDYGGRGIKVCKRWQKFENFFADMGPKPSPAHSIDRIDNNAGYTPKNCRWATRIVQSNNRRSSRPLSYDGRTQTLAEWAREFGLSPETIAARMHRGWSLEQSLQRRLQQTRVRGRNGRWRAEEVEQASLHGHVR